MSKAKPTLASQQRQIDELTRRLAAASPPAAPETSLTELRRRLKEHRLAMKQIPGGIMSLDDERTEMLLVRAIELAKAPEAARASAPGGHEVALDADRHARRPLDEEDDDAE